MAWHDQLRVSIRSRSESLLPPQDTKSQEPIPPINDQDLYLLESPKVLENAAPSWSCRRHLLYEKSDQHSLPICANCTGPFQTKQSFISFWKSQQLSGSMMDCFKCFQHRHALQLIHFLNDHLSFRSVYRTSKEILGLLGENTFYRV